MLFTSRGSWVVIIVAGRYFCLLLVFLVFDSGLSLATGTFLDSSSLIFLIVLGSYLRIKGETLPCIPTLFVMLFSLNYGKNTYPTLVDAIVVGILTFLGYFDLGLIRTNGELILLVLVNFEGSSYSASYSSHLEN